MGKIYKNAAELVGNTPLLEVGNIEKELGLEARILVKLEYFNPAGSAKDRIALNMIEDAEAKGQLKPGAVIIEPTSGNTGIGLASLAAIKGYKVILTMPETMSVERRNILKAYGAEIVLTDGSKGKPGNPQKNYRTGNMERRRRTGRHFCGWRWYRRNYYWCGRVSEIPESGCESSGSRAGNFSCAFSGKKRPA